MTQVSRSTFDEVMVPIYQPETIVPVRGRGSRIWDQAGNEYVDFAAGIAVTSLGHANPRLIRALTGQAEILWHVSNVVTNEPALRLAQRLCALTFAERVFFTNSGAEANEAAFKLARRWGHTRFGPDKHVLLSFTNSFHGRTLFTVSVGGQEKYTRHFEPLPGGIRHLPFNDADMLSKAIDDTVCGVVMEPVQGEGGVTKATRQFAEAARALCDRHSALLILDEVQTGIGRTGTLFAYEQLGITPDILTTAKGLGGGFPIGAMLTTTELAHAFSVGSHGTTFGGNPLACSVAAAVLDELTECALLKNVEERSNQLRDGLTHLSTRYGLFGAPRGSGLLIGAPLSDQWTSQAKAVASEIFKLGVWVLTAGPDVLRITPALNISEEDVAEGLARLERACVKLTSPRPRK